jgi:tetratricopeptide (TPR) repeat protein
LLTLWAWNWTCRRFFARRDAGEFDKALADFEKVANAEDPYPELGRRLDYQLDIERARLWATCPKDRFRDGKRAVEAARRAIATYPFDPVPWYFYDTLAAACAEAGDFTQAVKSQERAIAKAKMDDCPEEELRKRLDLYKNHTRYRQRSSDPLVDWRGNPVPPW